MSLARDPPPAPLSRPHSLGATHWSEAYGALPAAQ